MLRAYEKIQQFISFLTEGRGRFKNYLHDYLMNSRYIFGCSSRNIAAHSFSILRYIKYSIRITVISCKFSLTQKHFTTKLEFQYQ